VQLAKESLDTHGIKAIFLFFRHSRLFLFRLNFLDGFWTVFQKSHIGVVGIGGLPDIFLKIEYRIKTLYLHHSSIHRAPITRTPRQNKLYLPW
jgi:hypothetical protein